MVDFTTCQATIVSVVLESVSLLISDDKVSIGRLFRHIMNKPYQLFHHHIFHLFFEYIEWFPGHAGENTTIHIKQGGRISIAMILDLDGVAGFP